MSAQSDNQDHPSNDWTLASLDFDAQENLVGFFGLLLKVDARNNPHLYQKSNAQSDAGYLDT